MKRSLVAACMVAVVGAVTVPMTFAPSVVMAQTSVYTVSFALGSASLSKAAQQVVADAAASFKKGNSPKVELVGHTDTTGSADFNQRLSEQRAKAVRDALIKNGVAADAIDVRAVGQTQLIVQTSDGVAEQANRVVLIDTNPADAAPAATTAATPAVSAERTMEKVWRGIQITPGLYYGFNGAQDKHLLGGNLSADYFVTKNISIGGEQALFTPTSGQGTFGARSVASADFHIGDVTNVGSMGALGASVGVNGGLIYGQGVNDDWIYGPEIGMSLGPMNLKAAYDISDAGFDDGTVSVTLGYRVLF